MRVRKIHGEGNHLIIDGFNVDKELLDDEKFIRGVLRELPRVVEMNTLTNAKVIKATPKEWDSGGITGFIILSESNIAIHTYPEERKFYLDLFSCMEFDVEKAVDYLKKKFGMKDFNKRLLKRGDY